MVVETYDKRLRQAEIEGDSGGSQDVGTTWDYDAADRRDGFERANAVLGAAAVDLNNRITGLEYTDTSTSSGTTTLTHLFYGYDAHGNRLFS